MARFAVAAVAAVAVGYFMGPQAGLQTFALVPGYGPPLSPETAHDHP